MIDITKKIMCFFNSLNLVKTTERWFFYAWRKVMPIITTQKLIDADKDADSLDIALNGGDRDMVRTRRGKIYPTMPNAIRQLLENGGFRPFANEIALKAYRPTVVPSAGKDLSTGKVWLWDGTKWGDTGLSELDQAKEYIDQYFEVIANDPEFLLAIADNSGNRVFAIDRDGYVHFDRKDEDYEFVKVNDETYTQLVELLDLRNTIATVSNDPEYLYAIKDKEGNVLFAIANNGDVQGRFNINYKDLADSPPITMEESRENTKLKFVDMLRNELGGIQEDGTWFFPYVKIGNAQVDSLSVAQGGFNENGSSGSLTKQTLVTIPEQNYMRIDITTTDSLPVVSDDRATGVCVLSNAANTEVYTVCKVAFKVQGNGTLTDKKKGYTFDFTNINDKKLAIKFGSMLATDSFHLKAFYRDPTHTRDQGGYRFWRSVVRQLDYPFSKLHNIIVDKNFERDQSADFNADAKFYPHGFPVEIHINGSFFGLYTLRLKKTRENYALNSKDNNHIFLDSAEYFAFLKTPFDYSLWEVKSPKMSDYEEKQPIPEKFSDVREAIERLFNFTSNLATTYADHAEYLNLPHWLLFYVMAEIIGDWDHNGNNYNLLTWDKKHWTIVPYDLDWTMNWTRLGETQSGYILSSDIWTTFRKVYEPEIKAMWTDFRKRRVLTVDNVVRHYINVARYVPRNIYSEDKEKWGAAGSFVNKNYPTMQQLSEYVAVRFDYLDSVWLTN